MRSTSSADICIVGAGMVGMSVAHQILERFDSLSIVIIDKEADVGKHGSGRNSGVLHAGLYYQPESLKAKVCVPGAKRLKQWCYSNDISVMECGKVVTPQKPELDGQLEVLLDRGRSNGATVEIIDEQQFNELVPGGRTSTGRAIWSEDTCIVKPIEVVQKLKQELLQPKNVYILDCYTDVFVWVGKKSTRLVRAAALKLSSELFSMLIRPEFSMIHRVSEGTESQIFKSKFVCKYDSMANYRCG